MDWLCLTDVDAFIYNAHEWPISKILMKFNTTVGSVGISLLNFDHNGHLKITKAWVIGRFTHWRHGNAFHGAFPRSSIIHCTKYVISLSIHNSIQMVAGKFIVDIEGNGLPLGLNLRGKSISAPHNVRSIRTNHCYCKEEFERKYQRNRAWGSTQRTWDVRFLESWNNGLISPWYRDICPAPHNGIIRTNH